MLATRGGVWFRVGATQELHVGVADRVRGGGQGPSGAPRLDASRARAARCARLEAGGFAVRWADPAEIPGATRFFVDDPWGNRLELLA